MEDRLGEATDASSEESVTSGSEHVRRKRFKFTLTKSRNIPSDSDSSFNANRPTSTTKKKKNIKQAVDSVVDSVADLLESLRIYKSEKRDNECTDTLDASAQTLKGQVIKLTEVVKEMEDCAASIKAKNQNPGQQEK
ncbi:uncharacterized protein LOC116346107 [Contarinia nasturtii]|uniref:uncharacterized protein LOC116346107 n=1 Tax=Contarinia nasturtii TaxID=265458 RepID=UPI0012D46C6B|nr:uncharacterized protein LOC116346107 [Contarinia nasturtii]